VPLVVTAILRHTPELTPVVLWAVAESYFSEILLCNITYSMPARAGLPLGVRTASLVAVIYINSVSRPAAALSFPCTAMPRPGAYNY
jgi:hypothetical protein